MIPKIIHYCWFGKGEKPKLAEKCISSWKRALPDYELKEWNESNFDININKFVKQAYEYKNYAFVSDYARAYALFHYGGIYLDTDVGVLAKFDKFLSCGMFAGFEEGGYVGTCVIGSEPRMPILEEYMEHYNRSSYILDDGSKYKNTNVVLFTKLLEKRGLQRTDVLQTVGGVTVYPRTFFSPYDYINAVSYITPDSCAIHHFAQTWLPKRVRLKTKIKRAASKMIGPAALDKIRRKRF